MANKLIYDSGAIGVTPGSVRAVNPPAADPEALPGNDPTPQARGPMPVIVGCPRSGTTLLAVMLDSHPQLAMPPETAFLPELKALLGKEGSALRRDFFVLLTTDRWGVSNWNDIGIDKAAYWRRLCALRSFSITGGLRILYGMYADGLGKRLFGEKTPADTHCMPQIEMYLPEARFIHIVRDPRDVVLSLRRTTAGRSVEQTARIWVDMVSLARGCATSVSHYHELRYEDLVLDPEAQLRKVCGFLELDYSSRMLDYQASGARHVGHLGDRLMPDGRAKVPHELRARLHENLAQPLRTDRVHNWRQQMSADDRAKVAAIAAPLMRQIGYDAGDAPER
ncbi:MAG: sulfotransferase family protein [Casimicrobiaceae bacterium]